MNSRVWMIGILLILAVICSSALSLVNIKTAPIIKKLEETSRMRTVLDVFAVDYDAEDMDSISLIYGERVKEREDSGLTLYSETQSGATAVSFSGGGFQGVISIVVALDGDTISGLRVVSQVETPGLGARIMEKPFQDSFIGKKVSGGITMTKSGAAGPTEFDAITGATETSRALGNILNDGFKRYFETVQ